MTVERPKFEDFRKTLSPGAYDLQAKDAFEYCMSACEPIITRLEKQLAEVRSEAEAVGFGRGRYSKQAELEKQLYEARAEIAELEVTQEKLANLVAEKTITWTKEKNGLEKQLAEARAEMEQRIAEAVLAESEWWHQGDYAEYSPKIARARIAANRAKAEGARKGETK